MNKKIILGSGALLLAAVGVFAGRAKFGTSPSIYVSASAGRCITLSTSGTITQFTTSGTGQQATIKTAGGVNTYKVWSTNTCSGAANVVHFKPTL